MQNLKHKFIISVIIFIFLVIWIQIFLSFHAKDVHSYATLIEGSAEVNTTTLELQKKYQLQVGDILSTGEKGLVVIEWGDGSITRLWANSQISIRENTISEDLSEIKIATDMIKWKAWTKVVTSLSKDNYFNMYFWDVEAGVRGTTFDIDLGKQTLYVEDHVVFLKKGTLPEVLVSENQPFSLSLFSFIDLQKYIKEFQDIDWKNINEKLDTQYREVLVKKSLDSASTNPLILTLLEIFLPRYRILTELHGNRDLAKIQTIANGLSASEKQKLYDEVNAEYQTMNFAIPSDGDTYNKKILYKKTLLLLTDDTSVKESLVKGSVYDVQSILSTKNVAWLQETLQFLSENENTVKTLPNQIKSFLNPGDINLLPDDLKKTMLENTKMFQDILQIDISKADTSLDMIKSLNDKAQDAIHSGLDKAFNTFMPK